MTMMGGWTLMGCWAAMLVARRGWSMDWTTDGGRGLMGVAVVLLVVLVVWRSSRPVGRAWSQLRWWWPVWRVAGRAGLGWGERYRLWVLARRWGVSSPLVLMVSSRLYERLVRRAARAMAGRRAERWLAAMQRTGEKLFGANGPTVV